MARRLRNYIPNIPYHIVQKSHNGTSCFRDDDCYEFYIEKFKDSSLKFNIKIHAYVLMSNYTQLLITPPEKQSIPELMKVVGGSYTRYFNERFNRSGSLWEGRYKSSLVQADSFLLKCHHYIESAPVRDGLVSTPGEYCWSTYSINAFGSHHDSISPHIEYTNLSSKLSSRCLKYREILSTPINPTHYDLISRALRYGHPLADSEYEHKLEIFGLKKISGKIGRPKNNTVK